MSVGSNRLLLSIYFHSHDPSTMYFQLTKPNSPIIDHKPNAPKTTRSQTVDGFSDDNNSPQNRRPSDPSCQCAWRRSRRPHQTSNNFNENAADPIGLNVLSSTCNALKTTRIALRNSFSQFNLFSASGLGPDSFEYQSHRYPLEVKGVRLARNKWTHLAFSVIASSKEMTVTIYIYILSTIIKSKSTFLGSHHCRWRRLSRYSFTLLHFAQVRKIPTDMPRRYYPR